MPTTFLSRLAAAGLLACAACVPGARAEDPGNTMGLGSLSCAQVNHSVAMRPETRVAFFAWTQGLMAGHNMDLVFAGKDLVNLAPAGLDAEAQQRMMLDFCARKPEGRLAAAAIMVYMAVRKAQGLPADFKGELVQPRG
jgi:hypothetical protein